MFKLFSCIFCLTFHVLCCVGKVSLRYSNRNGQKPAKVLMCTSDVEDGNVAKSSPYVNTNDINPGLYEVPISLNQNRYDAVVDCRTGGPVTENSTAMLPLYDSVGCDSSSASSNLFYQYVPSKVSTLLSNMLDYSCMRTLTVASICLVCACSTCCPLLFVGEATAGFEARGRSSNLW